MSNKISNVEAILAVDSNFGIAKDDKIPWKSKADLQFFKNKTINNVVVMGSKTLLSLPNSNPLSNRMNIVLTNNYDKYSKIYEGYDNIRFVNYKHIINLIKYCYKDKTIFIISLDRFSFALFVNESLVVGKNSKNATLKASKSKLSPLIALSIITP